jgi:hypothetical protein
MKLNIDDGFQNKNEICWLQVKPLGFVNANLQQNSNV